jgi:hypothetical protein
MMLVNEHQDGRHFNINLFISFSFNYIDYCDLVRGAKGKGHMGSSIPGTVLITGDRDLCSIGKVL